MNDGPAIRHLGRHTRATVNGDDTQLAAFGDALLRTGFRLARQGNDGVEWCRRADLLHDDWPVRVSVRRRDGGFEIDYRLFIPWGWIAGLVFLMLVVLPFAGIPNATLAFVLTGAVVAMAVARQAFDCRPDARFWQQRARRRWGRTLQRLLNQAFG